MAKFLKRKKGSSWIELPTPSTQSTSSELIWSSDTGRTLSGKMVGTVIAEKSTHTLGWNVLSKSEVTLIRNNLSKGFFRVSIDGVELNVYRGTFNEGEKWKTKDGNFKYRNASITLIER